MTRTLTDAMLRATVTDMMSHVKFFPRDIVTGRANAAGDTFTAFFMTGNRKFRVIEHHGDFFFAKAV